MNHGSCGENAARRGVVVLKGVGWMGIFLARSKLLSAVMRFTVPSVSSPIRTPSRHLEQAPCPPPPAPHFFPAYLP